MGGAGGLGVMTMLRVVIVEWAGVSWMVGGEVSIKSRL